LKGFSYRKRGAIFLAPLLAVLCLTSLLMISPVQAEGGLAISGSFYRQDFEIPQGSSINSPDVYVVVFNNGETSLGIKMAVQTPLGVKINLSQSEFTLPPGKQQQVNIGIEVTKDATPGGYELTVTAESSQQGVTGIQVSEPPVRPPTDGAGRIRHGQGAGGESGRRIAGCQRPAVPCDSRTEHRHCEQRNGNAGNKSSPGSFIARFYRRGEAG